MIMSLGLVGRKVGMTRVFTDDGISIPVTVLEVVPNRVTQIKTNETDGYQALQVAHGSVKPSKLNKATTGHYAKAAKEAGAGLKEFKLNSTDDLSIHSIDSIFSVDTFEKGQKVDVTGVTIGKGFSGAQKRHHFRSQRATHGVSVSHNSLGSTGHCQDPGRVFPGKKMSGQLGSKRRTTQNLEVVRIDSKRNLILIKGAIPGSKGSDIEIKPAIKVKVGK
jgi:large subunit ribosomal protein L3